MKRLTVAVLLLCSASGVGAAAPTGVPRLLEVTDKDADKIRDGCETWFTQGETGYLFQAGRDIVIHTGPGATGLKLCKMTDAQTRDFGSGPTAVSCGGMKISIKPYGRATGNAEADSSQSPAVMTLGNGKQSRPIRGTIGTAC